MSKQLSPILSLLKKTCLWYSGISLLVLVFLFFSGNKDASSIQNLLLIFPFSLCLSVAGLVRRSDRLPTALRIALHPVCVLGGFFLFFYLPLEQSGFVIPLTALVIYAITMLTVWLCHRGKQQKKAESSPYVSQFGSKS